MEAVQAVDESNVGDLHNFHSSGSVSTEAKSDVNSALKLGSGEFIHHERGYSSETEIPPLAINENSDPKGLSAPADSSAADLINSSISEGNGVTESTKATSDQVEPHNGINFSESEAFDGDVCIKSTPADFNEDAKLVESDKSNNLESEKDKIPNITVSEMDLSTFEKEDEVSDSQKLNESTDFKANENSSLDNATSLGNNESSPLDNDDSSSIENEWLDILGSGHLLKKIVKRGIPDTRPSKSDVCILSFTGRLDDGSVVERVENLKIHLSDNEVIQGIDFALALMDKGEEAELKIGPRFAYGPLGRKPDIPSGATLYYDVKLVDVQEEPLISTLSVNERISIGLQKKERGNWWYSRDEHSLAINCYRRALEYFDDTDIPEPHSEGDLQKLLEERLKTYNNLGASQMKINAFDAALMSVNNVLTSQPKNVKALFRKSKILREKGEIQEAINTVRLALSHDPDSQSLQQELSSLLAAQRKANTKQRELYKKMLGNSSNQGKANEKKEPSNSFNTIKWATLIGFAVCVLGTIAVKYKSF